MLRSDWLKAVDAQLTTQPEEGAVSTSLESKGRDAGRKESPPWVLEKVQGKRVARDELAQKKRKTAGVAPHKPSGISLGGAQTTRTQSAAVSEWSDDNGAPVVPPPSTEAPPHNTHTEVQSEGGEGVPEQQARGGPER